MSTLLEGFDFESVNEFVYQEDVQFEDMQGALLDLASRHDKAMTLLKAVLPVLKNRREEAALWEHRYNELIALMKRDNAAINF